ncbi:hypothetical protein A5790_20875 [Mycobacterium sp. 852002-51152_SCH6134967]|nr:hypothetical protein A5790_20875 [Mycobacterium sp. 852002-51152_SCH6134967]
MLSQAAFAHPQLWPQFAELRWADVIGKAVQSFQLRFNAVLLTDAWHWVSPIYLHVGNVPSR